ncbi:tyrosine-type recombinase/integrase [Smaragdicoccus niigatensis]|uniref:tyrosine-type recombinase/integrase n=1 Tax=Smaragdicoccus niigatensis TaxID=359359 RepID=UPI00037EF0DF|nr:site-specific integrase [Smaragdicoccus niigatensis]
MASIEKRLRDGKTRWYARYRAPDGAQRTKTFDRKVDAEKFLVTVENSKLSGSYIDPNRSKVKLGPWADDWIASQTDLAPKTRDRYEGIIRAHIKPRWESVGLADIGHAEVQKWVAGLDLAPASVRKIHRVLSMMLDWAVADDRLAKNPADKISLPRVEQKEMRFLDYVQVEQIADECAAVWSEYGLVVRFLAHVGVRWGEMAALRVRRIDFLRRRILVAESVTPVKGVMTFGPTKGHLHRQVALQPWLCDLLAAQVAGKGPDDLVFSGERGGVMRSQTFQRAALTVAADKVGVSGFHPHELRHTFASLALASGADIKVVQNALGHKTAMMTMDLYGHLMPDRLDVVADAMDAARRNALADVYPLCTGAEIRQLRTGS